MSFEPYINLDKEIPYDLLVLWKALHHLNLRR